MLQVIKEELIKITNNIDSGNSNISEEDAIKIMKILKEYSNKDVKLSKYQAYRYLNISRATFDNYVRNGKIPHGKKEAGFKEKFWIKKDLDKIKVCH
jgi:predicted site-specific integrase-resolvase